MKQYVIIRKALKENINGNANSTIFITDIFTENNKAIANDIINTRNIKDSNIYKYELVELASLVSTKAECDMDEEELKTYNKAVSNICSDLDDLIDYDEWAYREFGETRIDTWYTAKKLLDAGYRKITKVEE